MDTHTSAASLPTLLLALITFGYLISLAVFPFKPCRRCQGAGKFRSPLVRAIRLCPRCGGTGLRLRTGRRIWNHLRRLNRDRH